MIVALIDTSIFCEILAVPGKANDPGYFREELQNRVASGEAMLLPMITILETGNHIGQCSADGGVRRQIARRFADVVFSALEGKSPFTPTPFFAPEVMRLWVGEFVEWSKRTDQRGKGSGFGDLTIFKEFERQCEISRDRVYIWSLDQQLSVYDRLPASG